MSGISLTKRLLAAWLILAMHAAAQTSSRLSSRFLARGEQALLEIAIAGSRPDAIPEIPELKGVDIRPSGRGVQTKLLPGRRLEYVFEFLVSSYEPGSHVLPGFRMSSGGVTSRTEPIEFSVFNPDELQWSEAVAGGTRFRYASAFRVLNARPYDGETVPVEIKIFVPRELRVEDWGIPDFQRDGVTAWRFQPSAMRGQVNLLGLPYVSVAYPSTLTPTRTGTIGIGPATVRLIMVQYRMDGIGRNVATEANLTVPGLELESMPLPEGAPAGFENAVGDFKIDVRSELTEAQEGDPVPVEILVSGSGNLDTLRPPKPVDASGWKLYEATTDPRGDERRELSGSTVFRQFLRPLEIKPAIPAFQLVYFDPKEKAYKTLLSEPIPLSITPSSAGRPDGIAPPQARATPVERMTDILGLLDTAEVTLPATRRIPGWLGHAVAALFALGLVIKTLWMRFGHHFHKDPERAARLAALREIEDMIKTPEDTGFLMAAGRFIERWLGPSPAPEVRAVLAQRDAICFREDKPAGPILDPKKRSSIVSVLRKAVMAWTAIALLGAGIGQARAESPANLARAAYESAKYDEAISQWLKAGDYQELSPDVLYNIGNACYRAGSPGHAALYYRRALARDPGHQESRQNLRFIERKHGSITVHRPEFQYAVARIPLSGWKAMLWTGAWLCVLAVLVFPATHRDSRLRAVAMIALVIAPLLTGGGALGWRYFPNDAEFSPLARQAVIIVENTVLHAEASRTSPEVIDAPPGSLCEVIRRSGRWAYVAFATKTRGWVPVEAIETVVPEGSPAPPEIRKAKADSKSA
ncbi:MAG: tetratricopeptide repeat protein [Luteolibacter sp.]|jgi:tetratricopeptide (TPR) repeat protein|nr:tetratricopeptide repeat protein [Luteolibacter sp.]